MKRTPNFNLYPEPYCIAKYENGKIICYENGRKLEFAERGKKEECKNCPQLTEAINMMDKR